MTDHYRPRTEDEAAGIDEAADRRRDVLGLAAVMAAVAGVPDEENSALAALDEAGHEARDLDEVAGPRAQSGGGDLARGHTPGPRLRSLADHATTTGTVPLGWDTWRDTPVLWDEAGHLAIHSDQPDRVHEAAHLATAVAVHLVQVHGPHAVTLVDATPGHTAHATAQWWAPLQAAGVDVRPLAVDPGHAVAALAAAADPLHRINPGRTHRPARFLVLLRADHLVDALADAGHHGYAAAARYALALIHARGAAHGIHRVATHAGDPARGPAPGGVASLSAPDGDRAWSYMARFTPHPAEVAAGPPSPRVAVTPPVDPAWWAAHLAQ